MNKIFLIWVLLACIGLFWLWQKDIISLQNWIIETYQLDAVQSEKLKSQILSPENYFSFQIFVSLLLIGCSALFFYRSNQLGKSLQAAIFLSQECFKTFLKPFQNLSKTNRVTLGLVFSLLNAYTLYRLGHKIPHIDEAFSYVHFASKGFLVSALYYPNPNNHILYNLCVTFWDIFLPNKIWAIRLPSLLSFLLLQILLFRFFVLRFSFVVSLLAVLFFSLLSPVQAYSIMGRGYLLQMLFLWLAVLFLMKILESPSPKSKQILFVLCSWAGFYAIPTYLYYFVSLGCLALIFSLRDLRKIFTLIKIDFIVILLVIFVYLPVYLLNGKANIFSESWQEFAKQEFVAKKYEYFANFGDFWIGIEDCYAFFWGIVGILAVMFLLQKKNKNSFLLMLMPVLALLIMFVQQSLLPERVWIGFALTWTMLLLLASQSLKKYANFLVILMVLGEVFVQFYQKNHPKNEGYANFAEVYPTIPFEKGQKVFSNDLIYQNLLAFYNLQDQKGLEVDYSDKAKPYEWIILEKNEKQKIPKNYFIWKETPFVMIFKRK